MSSVLSPVSDASGSPPEGGSEEVRGRNIKREGDGMDTAEDGAAQAGGATPRKRRRSRKGQDKRYMCDAPNCGRAYSRAEHLYRHQLNRRWPQPWPGLILTCPRPAKGDLSLYPPGLQQAVCAERLADAAHGATLDETEPAERLDRERAGDADGGTSAGTTDAQRVVHRNQDGAGLEWLVWRRLVPVARRASSAQATTTERARESAATSDIP